MKLYNKNQVSTSEILVPRQQRLIFLTVLLANLTFPRFFMLAVYSLVLSLA